MADRVHPGESPPFSGESTTTTATTASKPDHPMPEKPVPPPGTYVVQVPKDQIYRYPPPENARRFQKYSRKDPRRSPCRRCVCWTLGLVLLLIVLLGAAAAILYLVFRPEAPSYAVEGVAVRGFNLTSPSPISPAFDVAVRAHNPNDRLGIYYERGSSVSVRYSDVHLVDGVIPTFFQPSNNVTVFQAGLRGSNILLTNAVRSTLVDQQRQRRVPLRLNVRAPVKIKVGAVKTWTITVKVGCDLTVDSLTAASKIVSQNCDYSVRLW